MIAAQVITIGDEILIGQIVDTNSAFISQKLDEAGIHVTRQITVGDSEKEIISAVDAAFKISNLMTHHIRMSLRFLSLEEKKLAKRTENRQKFLKTALRSLTKEAQLLACGLKEIVLFLFLFRVFHRK